MAIAKHEPVIREEYLRSMISVKKVIFLFAIARLVKAGSITLPYPPEVKQAVLLYQALRLHLQCKDLLSVLVPRLQGPVVYLAPQLQVAVQGLVVFGSVAASGSTRTNFCFGSAAASGSARTIRMNLAYMGRNTVTGSLYNYGKI